MNYSYFNLFQGNVLGDAVFRHYAATLCRHRNRLVTVSNIRNQVSEIMPDIKIICNSKTPTYQVY